MGQASITSIAQAQVIGQKQFKAIYNEYPAQGHEPPYIVIEEMGHNPMKCLDGTTGMAMTELDIDCYAKGVPEALALRTAVDNFLKDYVGTAGPDDTIRCVLFNDHSKDTIPLKDGSDQRLHIRTSSFQIFHV